MWISASSYSGKEPAKSALCKTNVGRRPILTCPYVALNHIQARVQPQFPLARGGRWKYGAKQKSVSLAMRYPDFPRKPRPHSPYHDAAKYLRAITRDESRERMFLPLPPKTRTSLSLLFKTEIPPADRPNRLLKTCDFAQERMPKQKRNPGPSSGGTFRLHVFEKTTD